MAPNSLVKSRKNPQNKPKLAEIGTWKRDYIEFGVASMSQKTQDWEHEIRLADQQVQILNQEFKHGNLGSRRLSYDKSQYFLQKDCDPSYIRRLIDLYFNMEK